MPAVTIKVSRNPLQSPITLKAILDSGADATIIPIRYLQQLKVRKEHTRWMSSVDGVRFEVDMYAVFVQIGSHQLMPVSAVGGRLNQEVIIGRDLLNHFIVTLNGLAHVIEVSDTAY